MATSVSIIVPTYREAENLPHLLRRIDVALQRLYYWDVIIVDDDSDDGTDGICKELACDHPLRLITRRGERGLATAALHGLENAGGEVLVVMDADLSHPPEAIPRLLEAVKNGADFVIGSRYVSGSSIDEEWGWCRRLNSKAATWLAQRLVSVRDPLAGFFAFKRGLIEAAEYIDPIGYKIGLELLVRCRPHRVEEVPIAFGQRQHGESKLSVREQIDFLRHCQRLAMARRVR